ncbi:MAG TPA: DNA-binding response regulator [Campylobacterales bacterium]|nr:DNA-binding response regulator [Campylobacterales bacterium]
MNKIEKKYNLSLLYIEDEPTILQNAVEFLSDDFLEVYQARDGKEGLALYFDKKPDIIITDIEMPNMNGLGLCKEIRKVDQNIPIIITTAFTDQGYLLQAIELNLVKYLIKPIQEALLNDALEQCAKKLDTKDKSVERLTEVHYFDSFNKTLMHLDDFVKLTANELTFLTLLIEQKHRVITYKEIENHIWNGEYMSEDALKGLVKNLRKKISKNFLQNHSKLGYKINLHHG